MIFRVQTPFHVQRCIQKWWLVIPSSKHPQAKVPLIGDSVQCLLQRCDALLCEACAPRCTISRCHGSSAGAKTREGWQCESLKKQQRRHRKKNAYTTKINTLDTPQSPVFCGEKRGTKKIFLNLELPSFPGNIRVTKFSDFGCCSQRVWREAPGSSDLSVALKLVEGTLKLWCRYVQHG